MVDEPISCKHVYVKPLTVYFVCMCAKFSILIVLCSPSLCIHLPLGLGLLGIRIRVKLGYV